MGFLHLKSSKIKNFLLKIFTVLFATFFTLLIINFVLFRISNNQILPRPLASSLTNYLFTYYPDTFNRSELKDYTAILGDSNAMGSGDGYLDNEYDYSIGHFLYKENRKNYLIFARAGYGSISAVSNYIKLTELENYVLFKKEINDPLSILFFFYEGNDLDENLKEFDLTEKKFQNIKEYVDYKINDKITINKKDIFEANFPIFKFLNSIKLQLINLSKDVLNSDDSEDILDKIFKRIKKIQGENIILANKDLLGDNKKSYWTNETKNGNIKNIRPIESAAGDLNQKQKEMSLQIFFESILFLKSWEKNDNIKIVFLPSPSTAYEWNDPINYYPRYSKGNLDYKKILFKENIRSSNILRNKIKLFSDSNDVEFIDLTQKIQEKAKTNILHGPTDWIHFNSIGYEFIADNL